MKKKEPSKFTLDEYNKRFSKKKSYLLKISEKDLKEFDKTYNTNNYLLKDRKWAKIGNDYYEVPEKTKNPIKWFKRLSIKGKVVVSVLLGGAVTTAIAVPTVYFFTDHYSDFSTSVRKVTDEAFGNIDFNATMKDFNFHGFDYGDLIDLTIHDVDGEDCTFNNLPIVTNYNEAGPYAMCLCNYEGLNDRLDLSFAMHPLKDRSKTLIDKKVDIKMKKKRGFQKTRELIKCPAKLTYEQVNRNNAYFANFRNVSQTGEMTFKNNILYRGSSPFNFKANGNDRYYIADQLMGHYKVNYEISLSCTMEQVGKFMSDSSMIGDDSPTKMLYDAAINFTEGSTEINKKYGFSTYNLAGDYFTFNPSITLEDEDKREDLPGGNMIHKIFNRMYEGIAYWEKDPVNRAMPVFYFHCNEGKDRTGFFGMLIEALCDCKLEDIVADYMLTFQHYYNITLANSPEKYNALAEQTIYRYIYSICIDNPVDELYKIDWNGSFDTKKEVEKILNNSGKTLPEYAANYLLSLCRDDEKEGDLTWEKKINNYILPYLLKPPTPTEA